MKALLTFQRVGFHRWSGAPAHRWYLSGTHRHMFHFRVELELWHDNRELEYHDMLDAISEPYPDGRDYETMSCEMIARDVLAHVRSLYGSERGCAVEVWEDGEVGARIED